MKSDNKTKRTATVGSTDYKGYCSVNVANSYDDITQSIKDKASDCGGVLDNSTDKYDGNRYRFPTKQSRDKFNREVAKIRKEKENKKINENKMKTRTYKVGDFRKFIKESATKQEFEPVKGKDVDSDNKKNNGKAYKDMESATAKYDGGMTKEKNFKLPDYDDNRGMESLRINNPNKPYSDRIKSQLKGFPSTAAEEIHKNEKLGNAEYGSDEIVKQFKDKGENNSQARKRATEIGLTGRELNKQEIDSQYNSLFKESKKIKKLTFRNTVFLNENHMLSRVPNIYMTEGNKFIMRDKNANEYIVEWHTNDKPEVTRHFTKENILEEQSRMNFLFNYKSGDKYAAKSSSLQENKEINTMLNRVRGLMK